MYEQLQIIGNVGSEPEMRYLKDGTAIANFSVAVNQRWKDQKSGETKERTKWFRVSVWGKAAEVCAQYIFKGMKVLVVGEVNASAFLDKNGQAQASLEVRAVNVRFLSSKADRPAHQDDPVAEEDAEVVHPF